MLWLVCAVLAAPALPAAQIVVADAVHLPLQIAHMDLLHDPSAALTLAQVRRPDIARSFAPAPPGIPNLGVGTDAVWARFTVRNAGAEPLDLLLALTDARMGRIAYWALDAAGRTIAEGRDGRRAEPAERESAHRWFLFELPLAPAQTATVYLRVQSQMGRRLDLRLTDRPTACTWPRPTATPTACSPCSSARSRSC
jgi:hypothetical protein